jgi:hypothetical protein
VAHATREIGMPTEITVRLPPFNPDATDRALYYMYDYFRQSEEVGGDNLLKIVIPEPIRFARYLLDNPEKWKEVQEAGKQADKLEREEAEITRLGYALSRTV